MIRGVPQTVRYGWDVCGHRIVRDAHPVVSMPSVHSLTPTEQAVLREIALGRTTREIAADRYVSFHTVITHRKNIFRKLGVNNVHEATKYAMRAGIIDVAEYCI